jgi:hypothetical protein
MGGAGAVCILYVCVDARRSAKRRARQGRSEWEDKNEQEERHWKTGGQNANAGTHAQLSHTTAAARFRHRGNNTSTDNSAPPPAKPNQTNPPTTRPTNPQPPN